MGPGDTVITRLLPQGATARLSGSNADGQAAAPDWIRAVPFGEGFIDYPAFFAGLRAGGFDGVATFEICSPLRGGGSLENLDRCATRYLDWMRKNGFIRS